MHYTPAFIAAFCALAITLFHFIWEYSRDVPVNRPVFNVERGVGIQSDDVPLLVFGTSSSSEAIDQADGGGKTAIFEHGFSVGAHHRFEVSRTDPDVIRMLYEKDGHSTVMVRFVGPDTIFGDAPFVGASGKGDVYIAGFACSGVKSYWEQRSVYHYAGGVSTYSVIHSKIPGLHGTQFVSSTQDIDMVLASDGMIYIGEVSREFRDANVALKTVLVGGRMVIEEVYKNLTFPYVRIASSTQPRVPTLVKYDGTCGSYTSRTVVCVLKGGVGVKHATADCNREALGTFPGPTIDSFAYSGSCTSDLSLPRIIGYANSVSRYEIEITADGACQQSRFRWVCVPKEDV